MTRSIEWNPKGLSLLAPLQRDAYERDLPIRRFDGAIYTDAENRVWFARGEELKHIGDEKSPAHLEGTGAKLDGHTSEPHIEAAPLPDRSEKTVRRASRKPAAKSKKSKPKK